MSRGGRGGRGMRGRSFPRMDRLTNEAGEIQPPPLFPKVEFSSTPLLGSTDDWSYSDLVKVKQAYRAAMIDSPYFLKPPEPVAIERYTDKYQISQSAGVVEKLEPDWSRLPPELRITTKRMKSGPSTASRKKAKLITALDYKDKFDELEKKESLDDGGSPIKRRGGEDDDDAESISGDEDDEDGEAVEVEEELDLDNDYNQNYDLSGESGGEDSGEERAYYG